MTDYLLRNHQRFRHLGRKQPDKPIGSLSKVAARLGKILGCEVPLVEDWLDEATNTIKPRVTEKIAAAAPGSVLVLQNVRAHDIDTVTFVLWGEDIYDAYRAAWEK